MGGEGQQVTLETDLVCNTEEQAGSAVRAKPVRTETVTWRVTLTVILM